MDTSGTRMAGKTFVIIPHFAFFKLPEDWSKSWFSMCLLTQRKTPVGIVTKFVWGSLTEIVLVLTKLCISFCTNQIRYTLYLHMTSSWFRYDLGGSGQCREDRCGEPCWSALLHHWILVGFGWIRQEGSPSVGLSNLPPQQTSQVRHAGS